MVQICQDLGQPYEEYNAQLMRLKRQEEANEDNGFEFRGGEENGYSQQQSYQQQGGYYQQPHEESPEANGYSQPPANRAPQQYGQGAAGRAPAPPQDEEGWGNEDILPD